MPKAPCRVVGIDHISIRVSDYQKSKAFYSKLFGFLGFEISDEYPSTIGWTTGKTRYWIAKETGVDAAVLCRFIQGKQGLSMGSLDRIADVIGLRVIVERQGKKKGR